MNVGSCKLIAPTTCKSNDSVQNVARIFKQTASRHIIVTNNDKPVGIISPLDIVTRGVAEGKNLTTATASEIMTTPVETAEAETEIERVYVRMIQKNILAMPITKEGKIIGILPFSSSLAKEK